MTDQLPRDVDRYLEGLFTPLDPALEHALAASDAGGLPAIAVSPTQGKFLHLLARMAGARRILELGTLGGYSTIWLARALPPDGRLVSLELSAHHAEVARGNLRAAGVGERCEVIVGPALASLASLETLRTRGAAPFDFVFIDADKGNYPAYLTGCLALARPGTVIVADNVVRRGAVLDAASPDANVQGARAFNAQLAADARLDATVLQLVGTKGHDGMAIAIVRA
ncbi:MAG: O-methyltransferase [Gemmatimonadetes bacterium]|nr:O-methyltransferase [Gemmatimonadota bacterium]